MGEPAELNGDGLMRLAEVLAYNLYLATLVGSPAPIVASLGARMNHPRVGDLVLEVSTIYREGDRYETRVGCRLGRLERIAHEPICSAEKWAEDGNDIAESVPLHDVWYLRLADGREYGWFNASFVAIPRGIYSAGREDLEAPFREVSPAEPTPQ